MKTLSLTAQVAGRVDDHHVYLLKSDWNDVTVGELIDYQTRISKLPRVRQLIETAAWLSDVPVEVLQSDISIAAVVVNACPWLSELPTADGPLLSFTHARVSYAHVGNLDTMTAGQLEALLAFLAAGDDEPTAAIHQLLAVLYSPAGTKQTADTVTRAAEAFKALPLPTAWPAISFFLSSSAPSARNIQQFSNARVLAATALAAASDLVAEKLATSASFSQRWRWKGAALWTRCAQTLLSTCSLSRNTAVSS